MSTSKTKTIIILGSSRSDGNTRQIVDFALSKLDADLVDLNDKEIAYFNYEYSNLNDDFIPLMEQLVTYDRWIFATPIYWYSMSAVMKTFFDRITDVLKKRRDIRLKMKGLSMGMISCGSDEEGVKGFEMPFERSADYLGMQYLGDVHTWIEEDQMIDKVKTKLENWIANLEG